MCNTKCITTASKATQLRRAFEANRYYCRSNNMTISGRLIIFLTSVLISASCANMDTVTSSPKDAGVYQTFTEDHELVKAAVLGSMQNLNINIKETSETPDGFSITFTKSVSAFSWGEVGRVLVTRKNHNTQVFVHSEKRSRYQITGTDEQDFANHIFSGTREILESRRK